MLRTSLGLLAALCLHTTIPAQLERVAKVLTETERTEHFVIRYRKNSRAGASVDRAAVMAERDLADMCKKLAFDVGKEKFVINLFDDVAELARVTLVAGNAGFSVGHQTFIPYDNDQTRYHEMVHLVAYRLPKSGREPRNLFFAEGLANALLMFVHGVHVHAVAAVELRYGKMPKLTEMTGARDFYRWLAKHPGLNTYDIAASYLRFLIDTHGIERVKKYYTGMTAQKAFGVDEDGLEQKWHAHLRKFELRPSIVTLLRKRRGERVEFGSDGVDPDDRLPKDVLGKAADWETVKPGEAIAKNAQWHAVGGSIQGRSKTNDWNVLPLLHRAVGDCALRAKVRVAAGTVGVQLQFGDKCQAMMTNAGLFLWNGGVRHQNREERLAPPEVIDLLVVRRGAKVQFFVDGKKVLEGRVGADAGVPSLGVAGGRATFENVRLRRLEEKR